MQPRVRFRRRSAELKTALYSKQQEQRFSDSLLVSVGACQQLPGPVGTSPFCSHTLQESAWQRCAGDIWDMANDLCQEKQWNPRLRQCPWRAVKSVIWITALFLLYVRFQLIVVFAALYFDQSVSSMKSVPKINNQAFTLQVHFPHTRFVLPLECHEKSAAPISFCLYRGPRGCSRGGCCAGNNQWQHYEWSVPLHPPSNAEHEGGQVASIVFKTSAKRVQKPVYQLQ